MILRSAPMRWLTLACAGLALFLVFLYLLFPVARINTVINQSLAGERLTLTPSAHKTVLPGLAWRDAVLSSEQGALLRLNRLELRPLLLPLLTGRTVLHSQATVGEGQLTVDYGLRGEQALSLEADRIRLEALPVFQTVLGGSAAGILRSSGKVSRGIKGLQGDIRLEVAQLELAGIKLGGFALPNVAGLTCQGVVQVRNGAARLESFTLQGDGIYMRLSGNLPTGARAANAPLDLILEIMPKAEFLESQKLVFLLLAKFMTSPGVYRLPVRGTLLKPEII